MWMQKKETAIFFLGAYEDAEKTAVFPLELNVEKDYLTETTVRV